MDMTPSEEDAECQCVKQTVISAAFTRMAQIST